MKKNIVKDKLLIVEDDPGLRNQLRWALSDLEVLLAEDRETALQMQRDHQPRVVLLDLGLPPDPNGATEGLATIQALLSENPQAKVIVSSGNEDRQNAVLAVRMGAYDFYPKPADAEVLRLIIDRALRLVQLEEENLRLARDDNAPPLAGIVASSPEMLDVCQMIERIAPSEVGVLLTGESGTGKEVLARAIHAMSPRAAMPLVAINCAAIPDQLLESELFGHEKGSFTGAVKQTVGKVELANSGTLFLDEIGDMPPPLQAKLLRFLQERSFERIGGRESLQVDVRVVAATNQDLKAMMDEGQFREDLFYRLNEIGIHIPPLREREGDIELLASHLLTRMNKQLGKNLRGFSTDASAAMNAYSWRGNVREMENRIKRAVALASGKLISASDLDLDLRTSAADFSTLKEVREQAESKAVARALALAQNNVSAAAKLLGVSRPTLYELMDSFKLRE